MDHPSLTIDEREAINAGRWFSSLSPSLRHDIFRCAYDKRNKDGALIAPRGYISEESIACTKGARSLAAHLRSRRQTLKQPLAHTNTL